MNKIINLPSAQPGRLTDDDFETIRIHLSAFKEDLCNRHRWEEAEEYQRIIDRFMSFASAQQWHEIHKTPMTEDERTGWSERLGYDIEYEDAFIYSNLPDDGQEVLVCTSYGHVYIDTFYQDDGCYFKDNGDMDGIVAWMPKPEPYKGAET